MNNRPDTQNGRPEGATLDAPRMAATLITGATPYLPNADRDFILKDLWARYGSVPKLLLRFPAAVAPTLYSRTIDTFYLQLAVMQFCILLLPFGGVLSVRLGLVLAMTFLTLMIREAYVDPRDRLECELVTTFAAPAVFVVLYLALGFISPQSMLPSELLGPRLVALSFPIGFIRYHYAPNARPGHPFKYLLQLHHRVWFFNYLWLFAGSAYLLTLEVAAPSKWPFQPFLTITPSVMLFSTSIRFQLNPLAGEHSKRIIRILLNRDPDEDEIRIKRHYLLTGADWFSNFDAQSLCEILSFAFALAPLIIAAVEGYIGDPNAAHFNWTQIAVNSAAWLVLILTWPYIKKINRETVIPFDQAIKKFRYRSLTVKAA